MPFCNEVDRDLDVIPCESKLTTSRSFFTR